MTVIFWQNCLSIHQYPLLTELHALGVSVIQIVEERIPAHRLKMGWYIPPAKHEVHVFDEICVDQIIAENPDVYHVFSGFQGFKLVAAALQKVYAHYPERCFVFQERPDLRGLKGLLRRIMFGWLCYQYRRLGGILAAGSVAFFSGLTRRVRVFSFPYYVYAPEVNSVGCAGCLTDASLTRFVFVGSLFPIKNIAGMCDAFCKVPAKWSLAIAGAGSEACYVAELNKRRPDCQTSMLGYVNNSEIGSILCASDCLVLPSWKDGYGAVVNEAALAGLRIICSEAAGASEKLKELCISNWYFDPRKSGTLEKCIEEVVKLGQISEQERSQRIAAARDLQPSEGAKYLLRILSGAESVYVA